jgi:AraC family transcriptional activator of tynA and feaB
LPNPLPPRTLGRDDLRTAPLPVSTWNTDDAPLQERFDFHREQLSRSLVPLTPRRPSAEMFYSRGKAVSVGAAAIITMQYTGQTVELTAADVAASKSTGFFIQMGLNAGIRHHTVDRGRQSFVAHAGQLVLTVSDGRGFYHCEHLAHVEQAVFWVPQDMLCKRLPTGQFPSAMRVSDDPLVGRLISQVSHTLIETAGSASPRETFTLFDVFLDLLALSISRRSDVVTPQPERNGMRLILRRTIDQHLHCEGLRVDDVARLLGITPRYVHMLFEDSGTTFGRYLLEQRLEGAARDLRDPDLFHRHVSQTAFHWGFSDLSHFSRTFRTRFRCSPTQWRQGTPGSSSRLMPVTHVISDSNAQ